MISSLKFIKFLHLPFVHLPVRSYAAIDAQCIIKVFHNYVLLSVDNK